MPGYSIYELLSIVKGSIRDIGSAAVLLLITPWDDPILLKRVWCLFEMCVQHH